MITKAESDERSNQLVAIEEVIGRVDAFGALRCRFCRCVVHPRKGPGRPHFYHAPPSDCAGAGGEGVEHRDAKLHLAYVLEHIALAHGTLRIESSCEKCRHHLGAVDLTLACDDRVLVEFGYEGLRVDVAVVRDEQLLAAFEVFGGHRCGEGKWNRLRTAARISVAEIDVRAASALSPEASITHVASLSRLIRYGSETAACVCRERVGAAPALRADAADGGICARSEPPAGPTAEVETADVQAVAGAEVLVGEHEGRSLAEQFDGMDLEILVDQVFDVRHRDGRREIQQLIAWREQNELGEFFATVERTGRRPWNRFDGSAADRELVIGDARRLAREMISEARNRGADMECSFVERRRAPRKVRSEWSPFDSGDPFDFSVSRDVFDLWWDPAAGQWVRALTMRRAANRLSWTEKSVERWLHDKRFREHVVQFARDEDFVRAVDADDVERIARWAGRK